jgi:hypothetical protein
MFQRSVFHACLLLTPVQHVLLVAMPSAFSVRDFWSPTRPSLPSPISWDQYRYEVLEASNPPAHSVLLAIHGLACERDTEGLQRNPILRYASKTAQGFYRNVRQELGSMPLRHIKR